MIPSLLARLIQYSYESLERLNYIVLRSFIAHIYPAFRTYQALQHPTSSDEMHRWLMYWAVLGVFHTAEGISDTFIWVPFYDEGKILLLALMAFPAGQGAQHVYRSLVQPFLRENESRIEGTMSSWVEGFPTRFGANLHDSLSRVNEYLQQLSQMPTPTTPKPVPTSNTSDFEDISSTSDPYRKGKRQ